MTIASYAVIAETIDERASAFYGKYGFISLDSGIMFLAMKSIEGLLNS